MPGGKTTVEDEVQVEGKVEDTISEETEHDSPNDDRLPLADAVLARTSRKEKTERWWVMNNKEAQCL